MKKNKRLAAQNNIIKALNFNYSGPIDGHNLDEILSELERLKKVKGPKFLHIITTKGKGLQKAEENQVQYHAPGKFDKITGEILAKETENQPLKYQDVFGNTIVELASKNDKIVGITPAMLTGSSLKFMFDTFPERTFDVGIAEQHAVTLAAGMATEKLIPFCAIYSTFLQRGYDQIIHDVALQNLPVIFCLDRAGLVGEDGATHHGVFDLAYLRCIPNMIVFSPRNEIELRNIMYTAQLGLKHPIAIRYPRGKGQEIDWEQPFSKIEIGKGLCLKEGNSVAILSIGNMAMNVTEAINSIENHTKEVAHYDMRFVKPLDVALLHTIFKKFDNIITIEDGTIKGGFGSAILEFAAENNYQKNIHLMGVPDAFIHQGTVDQLQHICGIDSENIAQVIKQKISS